MLRNKEIVDTGNYKKDQLLRVIDEVPGVRYRELLRKCKFNNGTLSYHIATLEKCSRIKVIRNKSRKETRFYSASVSEPETAVLGFLRIRTTKKIILFLIERKFATFNELVILIGKSPSTTSWYLKRLADSRILIKTKKNKISNYLLQDYFEVENATKKFGTSW